MEFDNIEFMIDDPVMDMVDAVIDEIEDARLELEACIGEADMVLVDLTVDKLQSVPGYVLGVEEASEEYDPYENVTLF